MSPQARMAAGSAPNPEAGVSAGAEDAGAGPFVINLTSSTTPMALAHPDTPELKRFTFFVSRRREDNRERFRLHMGYFSTLAEAEEWLNIIRDLYPGAWAGEAPGKKLRARAAAAELAKQLPPPPAAAKRAPAAPPAPPASRAPAVTQVRAATAPAAQAPIVVPTLQAAPPAARAVQPPVAASAAPMLEAVAQAAAALAAVAKTAVAQSAASAPISFEAPPPVMSAPPRAPAPVSPPPPAPLAAAPAPQAPRAAPRAGAPTQPAAPVQKPAASAPPARLAAAAAAAAAAAPSAKSPKRSNPLVGGSNVREVMASLDETGETRQMKIPAGLRPPAVPASAAPKAAQPPAAVAAPRAPAAAPRAAVNKPAPAAPAARAPAPPAPAAPAADSMSDTQVLRMLETRRTGDGERETEDANAGISLLKPDDTQTRRALKEAVLDNAPVAFAVQLQWSVQPVDLASVPPLAIFSAYTLYTVEGSREGRKWYGLRLGFFSDAISAKQVAYYVRSEFNSVAVVPVSPAEKGRATEAETKASTGAFQRKPIEQKIEEFKLFDDDKPVAPEPPPKAAPVAAAEKKGGPARKNKPLGKVRAKEQRSPKTLEETLEILGASDLEIDNGRGELLNDTGVRHLRVEVQKNTPFAKLLDRLSERVRRN